MKRLVITLSFPTKGFVSVNDISEHCYEEFRLAFPRTKSESNLSEVVSDTFIFEFSRISVEFSYAYLAKTSVYHFIFYNKSI